MNLSLMTWISSNSVASVPWTTFEVSSANDAKRSWRSYKTIGPQTFGQPHASRCISWKLETR